MSARSATVTPAARSTVPYSFSASILPPRSSSSLDIEALETTMHNLAVDARHPVSLEIVGTAVGREFLVRATNQVALTHLMAQIQAHYPQAEICIHQAEEARDPLLMQHGEACSVVELKAGAASYLALRQWRARDLKEEGADPMLGILGALTHLPESSRLIAQLAMVPTRPTWSANNWRKTVEHPLDPERQKEQRQSQRARMYTMGTPSLPVFLGLGVLAIAGLLWRFKQAQVLAIAPWIVPLSRDVMQGKIDIMAPSFQITFWSVVGGIVLLSLSVRMGLNALGFGQASIYDMRQVDEKARRFAYHARFRLIAIGPRARRARRLWQVRRLAVRWRKRHPRRFPSRMSLQAILRLARVMHKRIPQQRQEQRQQQTSWNKNWKRVWFWDRHLRTWLQIRFSWHRDMRVWRLWWKDYARYRRDERPLREQRYAQLQSLTAAYQQYHQAKGAFFRAQRYWLWNARRVVRPATGWLSWWNGWQHAIRRSQHILSAAEVASLWHLPQSQDLSGIPLVAKEMNKTILAPRELVVNDGTGHRIGQSVHAGYELPVYLPARSLVSNVLAVASTGKGKSTLFQHLAEARLAYLQSLQGSPLDHRMSLAVVEPHGDFLGTLAGRIPPSLADRVMIIDLADIHHPPGINPLDMTLGRDRDKTVDNLIVTFKSIWDNSWGPRTENIMEFSLKTLAEVNELLTHTQPEAQYTLLDIVPLLRNASFRHEVLGMVRDETIKQWWEHYYELMHPNYQTEVISSVINKMSKYSSSRTARRILGQSLSTVNLREVIDQGQILLISTASGIVGSDISSLIGATLLNLFQTSLAEQASIAPEERRKYFLVIDEFQTFLGADYQTMLAELRKYGGSFALATQSLAYLDKVSDTLRSTVLANVDHLFAFDMAGEDAKMILPELDGVVEVEDVTNLDNYCCYAKLSLDGRRLPLFSLNLDAPGRGDLESAQQLRLRNRQRYGRPADIVDALFAQRLEALRALENSGKKKPGGEKQSEKESSEKPSDKSDKSEQYVKKRGSYGSKKGGGQKQPVEPPLRDHDANLLSVPLAGVTSLAAEKEAGDLPDRLVDEAREDEREFEENQGRHE